MPDDDEEKTVGEETYKRLLSVIRANVGGPQHVLFSTHGLGVIFCNYIGESVKTKRNPLTLARERNDIVEWTDETGEKRIALTLSAYSEIEGTYPYSTSDTDQLTQVIETEVSKEEADKDIVGWANKQITEIADRDSNDGEDSDESTSGSTDRVEDKDQSDISPEAVDESGDSGKQEA